MTEKMQPLTPKMLEAIDRMKAHDNKFVRYPGGYWAAEGWHMWHGPSFGTPTIEALVRRGVAEYTVWHEGRNGKFPIEVALKESER